MNKLMIVGSAAVLAGLMAGCSTLELDNSPTCPTKGKACEHECEVKTETYVWSSDQVSQTVFPDMQGPVDTYRPIYKVGDKKYSAKGIGTTDKQAVANAIYNMCKAMNCDYVATAKCMIKKTVNDLKGTSCEADLIGYPIFITGVETVKPKFYEQQSDGTLKAMELEHRYVLTTNNMWNVNGVLKADKGTVWKADEPALISTEKKTVRTCLEK